MRYIGVRQPRVTSWAPPPVDCGAAFLEKCTNKDIEVIRGDWTVVPLDIMGHSSRAERGVLYVL